MKILSTGAREYEVSNGEVVKIEVTAVGTNYFLGVPAKFRQTSTSPHYIYEYEITDTSGRVKSKRMYFEFHNADAHAKYKVAVSGSLGDEISNFEVPFIGQDINRETFTFKIV